MAELSKVVARFADGRVLRGTTLDFVATRPIFHLIPAEGGEAVKVRLRDLKAVFFVRDYVGNSEREDARGFVTAPAETAHGKKIAVHFKDGELICGYTLSFTPDREGFFLFPSDQGGNNLRIYVLTAATKLVKAGPAAEALALSLLGPLEKAS